MVYKWKSGSFMTGDAQVAGEVCEGLCADGELTPETLVDASRSEDAPLHGMFTWDDTRAAELWRRHEAGRIIRCLVTVVAPNVSDKSEDQAQVRSFVSISHDDATKRKYERIDFVLRDESSRSSMLLDARRDMLAFQRKYGHLAELVNVCKAIDEFVGKLPIGESE